LKGIGDWGLGIGKKRRTAFELLAGTSCRQLSSLMQRSGMHFLALAVHPAINCWTIDTLLPLGEEIL